MGDERGVLLGRDEQLADGQKMLDDASSGAGSSLSIEGDAGIGKTALALELRARAEDEGFAVLGTRGIRGGSQPGFSGLHELLLPVLPRKKALPPRQRRALDTIFGLSDGQAPEPLVIHVAVMALLEEAAAEKTMLLLVDDLHWLDRSTAEVVAFLAPRLGSVPVALLATSRRGSAPFSLDAFTRRMMLSPLSQALAATLVESRLPDSSAGTRQRIVRESLGNPLALTELSEESARVITSGHRSRLPLTQRLEQAFLAETGAMPERTQRALLLAATGDGADLRTLDAALARVELSRNDLTPAQRAGLVLVGADALEFRHPLVASAIYDAADVDARVEAHSAWAAVVRNRGQAVRHRAAATMGWDEDIASQLDGEAQAAFTQGARAEATESWRIAADLSPREEARSRRLALAAESARQNGDVSQAGEIAASLRTAAMDGSTLQQLVTTEWMLSQTTAYPGRTVSELMNIALSLDRVEARVQILVFAAVRCYILQEPEEVSRRVAMELASLRGTGQDALIEVGSALVDPGRGVDVGRALEAFQGPITAVDAVLLNCLAFAEEEAQNLRGAERVWTAATAAYHEAARTGDEATGLCGRSSVRLTLGEIRSGMADAEHALRLSDDLSLGVVGAMAATVIAQARGQRGEFALAREALKAVITRGGSKPFARVAASMAWAEGVVAAAEGRHADAVVQLQRTKENAPIALWAGAALAESAIRSGRTDLVGEWLRTAGPLAELSGSHILGMLVDRTNGLLDEAHAERHFDSALAHGLLAESSVELARTQLYYGEWLRRNRRIKDARDLLRSALAVFESESMGPAIARASEQLRAAGEGGRTESNRSLDAAALLTGQELLIARQAANGMSNKEIADSIYLSHRTVGAHLHRAFAKLGISRRSQLSVVLGND